MIKENKNLKNNIAKEDKSMSFNDSNKKKRSPWKNNFYFATQTANGYK